MLTVNSSGANGVTISSTTGHGGTTNYTKTQIASGTSVNLSAPTTDPTGYTFANWTLDGVNQTAGQKSLTFTMTAARTAVAVYNPVIPTYTLTVNASGASGVIISSTTGHGGTTNYTKTGIASGTSVNLSAPTTDPTGYTFANWTLDGINQPAGQKSLSFSMTSDRTATAIYNSPLPGDFNGDGHVTLVDFNILVNHWLTLYHLVDFNNLVNHWGQ